MQIASLGVAPAAEQTGRVEAARAAARERQARERAAAEARAARAARERAAAPAPVGPTPEPPVVDDEDAAPLPGRAARPPRVRSLLLEMCADETLPASFCRAD
jgi:septal ring factor EnvC (AmiA/AmiB activator)